MAWPRGSQRSEKVTPSRDTKTTALWKWVLGRPNPPGRRAEPTSAEALVTTVCSPSSLREGWASLACRASKNRPGGGQRPSSPHPCPHRQNSASTELPSEVIPGTKGGLNAAWATQGGYKETTARSSQAETPSFSNTTLPWASYCPLKTSASPTKTAP